MEETGQAALLSKGPIYEEAMTASCAQNTFSKEHTAHSVVQDKVVSASLTIIPHAHSHLAPFISLLHVPFVPFPSLLSSSTASPSRSTTTVQPFTGRSLIVWPIPSQKQVMNSNSPTYANSEHNPIDISDNNPDLCSDATSTWFPAVYEVRRTPKH